MIDNWGLNANIKNKTVLRTAVTLNPLLLRHHLNPFLKEATCIFRCLLKLQI